MISCEVNLVRIQRDEVGGTCKCGRWWCKRWSRWRLTMFAIYISCIFNHPINSVDIGFASNCCNFSREIADSHELCKLIEVLLIENSSPLYEVFSQLLQCWRWIETRNPIVTQNIRIILWPFNIPITFAKFLRFSRFIFEVSIFKILKASPSRLEIMEWGREALAIMPRLVFPTKKNEESSSRVYPEPAGERWKRIKTFPFQSR